MDAEDRLDEDFMFYLSVSERNWKNLKTEKDKDLAQEWLYKLTAVQHTKAEKRDRNVYLSQLALSIGDGELTKPFFKRPPEGSLPTPSEVFGPPQPRIEVPPEFRKIGKSEDLITTYTSKDGRTYVATKSLGKDHGAYTYIGISLADTEPLWVGGDTPEGPCYGLERHFQKPQTLYSKPRPRPQSSVFAMEREGGDGDSPDDTRIFTDYVTGAINFQMSGTHSKDSQPSFEGWRKSFRLSGIREKGFRSNIELPRKSLLLSGMRDAHFRSSVGVLNTAYNLPAEEVEEDEDEDEEEETEEDEEEADPAKSLLKRLSKDATVADKQMDVAEFYTKMITHLDKTTSEKDEVLEAAEKTREAVLNKLKRVKEEESRVSESIKAIEIMHLPRSSGTDDSVIETWEEACKLHDEKNLQLLEEVYNQRVRERMAEMMTHLKLRAVRERGKHMKAHAAAATEDFNLRSQELQEKLTLAENLIDRIQAVLGEMVQLKTAAARENHFDHKRKLAESLQVDVDQLKDMYNAEYGNCRNIEREIFNRDNQNGFSHPEFTRLSLENQKLINSIKEKKDELQSKLRTEKE